MDLIRNRNCLSFANTWVRAQIFVGSILFIFLVFCLVCVVFCSCAQCCLCLWIVHSIFYNIYWKLNKSLIQLNHAFASHCLFSARLHVKRKWVNCNIYPAKKVKPIQMRFCYIYGNRNCRWNPHTLVRYLESLPFEAGSGALLHKILLDVQRKLLLKPIFFLSICTILIWILAVKKKSLLPHIYDPGKNN
jgi:hypothetical protein